MCTKLQIQSLSTGICVLKKKKGLKDKNNKYVFILIFYGNVKKNDLCFEMKHAFIVKLIMLF